VTRAVTAFRGPTMPSSVVGCGPPGGEGRVSHQAMASWSGLPAGRVTTLSMSDPYAVLPSAALTGGVLSVATSTHPPEGARSANRLWVAAEPRRTHSTRAPGMSLRRPSLSYVACTARPGGGVGLASTAGAGDCARAHHWASVSRGGLGIVP
jgi:hypothetical protein